MAMNKISSKRDCRCAISSASTEPTRNAMIPAALAFPASRAKPMRLESARGAGSGGVCFALAAGVELRARYACTHHGRKLWQCLGCGYPCSSIVGTVFEHTKLPLSIWFLAIYLLTLRQERG